LLTALFAVGKNGLVFSLTFSDSKENSKNLTTFC